MDRVFDIEGRLVSLAVQVTKIAEGLPTTRAGTHAVKQLIRCGTSPAPNYGEAQSAESRRDFIHKLRICVKELRETRVWLEYIRQLEMGPQDAIEFALDEVDHLIAILYKSIQTAQKNAKTAS